jgi:hypothetical protein
MSEEKPAEKPKSSPEPPPAKPADPTPADKDDGDAGDKAGDKDRGDEAARSRDQALNQLREQASAFSNGRFGKIVNAELGRLENVVNLNVFQGDIAVDGDFVTGGAPRRGGARRAAMTRVDLTTLDHYVRPAEFESGVDMLDRNNLVIFSGRVGTGRRSRALASLVEVLGRAGLAIEVFEPGGNVLGNKAWRVPKERCGLLVVDQPREAGKAAAESADDDWLAFASAQLREHGSYLVVVTVPLHGHLGTEFVLEDLDLPEPMEIVRKRIANELPWLSQEEVDRRLGETELAEILLQRDTPSFAAKAAGRIVNALRDDAVLAEIVAQLNNPVDEVAEWLRSEPDRAEIAFTLATAVLEGSSYLNISDAAMALYRAAGGGSGELTPRYLRDLMSTQEWIEYRPGSPPVVRFRREQLRRVVLTRVWLEFDGMRAKVLAWLTKLAGHPDVEVRARVAVAAGVLATEDFEHGLYAYLQRWGNDELDVLRQSAAQGLNVAGRVAKQTDMVWKHVERWADRVHYPDATWRLPATAALAAGGLGVDSPRRALKVLRTLICDGDFDLLPSAAAGTQELLEAGRMAELLEAFLEWTESTDPDDVAVKALAVFIYLTSAESSADDAVADLPVMMPSTWEHREALAELWGRALSREAVRSSALAAIQRWVREVDRDRSVFDVVLYLLDGIAERGEQDFKRLQHALQEWAEDQDDPSDAAADFYHELVDDAEGLTA